MQEVCNIYYTTDGNIITQVNMYRRVRVTSGYNSVAPIQAPLQAPRTVVNLSRGLNCIQGICRATTIIIIAHDVRRTYTYRISYRMVYTYIVLRIPIVKLRTLYIVRCTRRTTCRKQYNILHSRHINYDIIHTICVRDMTYDVRFTSY